MYQEAIVVEIVLHFRSKLDLLNRVTLLAVSEKRSGPKEDLVLALRAGNRQLTYFLTPGW